MDAAGEDKPKAEEAVSSEEGNSNSPEETSNASEDDEEDAEGGEKKVRTPPTANKEYRSTIRRAHSIAPWRVWNTHLAAENPPLSPSATRNTVEMVENPHWPSKMIRPPSLKPQPSLPVTPPETVEEDEDEDEEDEEDDKKPKPNSFVRFLSYLDGTMPEWSEFIAKFPALDFIDYNLRGVGQVMFMNSPLSGVFILVGLFIASVWAASCGVLGLLVATTTARALRVNNGAIRGGLFGYNGILVGLALATFLEEGQVSPFTIVGTIISSLFSTVFTVAIGNLLIPKYGILLVRDSLLILIEGVPPFTLPFNFATALFLLASFQFSHFKINDGLRPVPIDETYHEFSFDLYEVLYSILRGIGQVYLQGITHSHHHILTFSSDNIWCGVFILLGIACCSRIAAVTAVAGSIIGILTAYLLGANVSEIEIGLWGYNAVLGTMAIGGLFYTLNFITSILAILCGILCTILLGTFKTLFAPFGLPAMTFPFCVGTMGFIFMQGSVSGAQPVELTAITTPEGNLRRFRADVKAFKSAASQGEEVTVTP